MILNLKRNQVCDILLALTLTDINSDATKWKKLHDEIKKMLEEADKKEAENETCI